MIARSRSALSVVLGLGLCAAACGSADQADYATADRILAAAEDERSKGRSPEGESAEADTELAPERLAAASDCELETREDEYGLEFEVCADDGGDETGGGVTGGVETEPSVSIDAPPTGGRPGPGSPAEVNTRVETALLPIGRFDELVSGLPAGTSRDQLTELGRALVAMDVACEASLEQWGVALASVTDRLDLAGAAVAADPALADLRGLPEGRELARVVVQRVMIPSGCVSPASDLSPVGGLEPHDIAELSSQAAAAVEPLYQALWGQAKSPFFYHPDELAHRQWMRDEALFGTEFDLVVVGTSQTLLGVEADLLGAVLGLEAGNAALPGAVAEVQQYWLPEVMEAVDPSVVLWGIGPLDLVTICKPDGRAEEFARLSTLKQDILAHLPAASTIPPLDLVAGPPGSTAYVDSPTSLALDRRFPRPRGDAFEFARPDPSQLRSSLEQFRAPFERADYCAERLPVIEATIAALVEGGHRVVIFGMPIAPSLAATYDGGIDALSLLVDQAAREVFEPAGAEYLGMMTSIDDDGLWYDVVHPTRAGGEALTTELATALAEVG